MLPMGDLVKGLKFADKAKDLLKLGDKALTATKTVAKEGAEKLSKQMTKLVKSGKIDNVIATMDAGKDFIVRFKNGSTALIKKGDLSEFVCEAFNKGCFMAGTLVTTKKGLKPIEEIKIGEYVLSRNEESGENSYKKVTDTLIRSTYNICTIELENGKIKSTTGHLFMVKDKWWKAAAELKAGDVLETENGKCQVVKSITVEEKCYPVTTYNLSVEDNHTFFVGEERVLTHNTKVFTSCELADEVAEKATKGVRDSNKILIKGDVVDKELLLQKPKNSPNPKRWLNNGGSISIDNDGVWTYIHPDGHSVKYTDGFPDFKSAGLVKQEVDIGEFNNYYDDFNKADELAPNGPRDATNNTWHHHQDGKTMQEVNKEIHKDYTHRGGMSIKKKK